MRSQREIARRVYSAAMMDAIHEAVAFVRGKSSLQPETGVILGSATGHAEPKCLATEKSGSRRRLIVYPW